MVLNDAVIDASDKLSAAKGILQEHGNYEWLTSGDKFVVLNNGIELAITYITMLLSLFFAGGEQYNSADSFLAKKYIAKL